jgi:predicted O-methyltransferase YrrM
MKSKYISRFFGLLLFAVCSLHSAAEGDESSELDAYLLYHGFAVTPTHNPPNNEGYMSDAQKQQFAEQLGLHPNIKTILEIGLNAGHSAYHFLLSCKNFEHFVSFDIEQYKYTRCAVNFLQQKYGERFTYIKGDSVKTVPAYHTIYPDQTFDLIYIDGNHDYSGCLTDIINCKKLANPSTLVWIDDYDFSPIQQAVADLSHRGIIEMGQVFTSRDQSGPRCWIQVRYR